ncbi:MAG: OmpH family outer membrane protein [Gemmatimonadaceae bacterium]|nr:OmpH family outer membrane protein [Gemmatimonadaceae bacterium]NUP56854.1 OmpH family outer membrane protein [Gemmatimonadaceae bacterium]NUS33246.1 OmpH family outer membrane protein [Gemmatimonadaceae bacterium]NUS47459.1 OmpH family outer membrane protein [Gemmatimonadaceae bacterium]
MRVLLRAASAALVLVIFAAAGASAQSGQKFAFIRSSVLLDQAPGRAEAEAQFDKETGAYQEQIKRMSDSLNAMVADFEKTQASISAATRDTRGKAIQAKQAEYERRTRDLQQKAQARQSELVQPILDRVKAAIEDLRVEGGYSFVFNADQGSSIVAMDKNLDITDRVLAKLRSGTVSTTPKPATGAPTAAPSGVTRPQTPPQD